MPRQHHLGSSPQENGLREAPNGPSWERTRTSLAYHYRWGGGQERGEVTMLPMLILDDRIRSTAKTSKNPRAV